MSRGKPSAIYVLKILQEYSDEQHILSALEIIHKLYALYSLCIDRRAVYGAIELLKDAGYDISSYEENNKGYYLRERDFEPSEIALLTDAVYEFPFISNSHTRELVDKLQRTQSCHRRKNYKHLRVQRTGGKTENPEVFLNIEKLDEAIEKKRMVSFTYLKYNLSKELVPRRIARYIVSPHAMVFFNDHYYLACTMADEESASLYRIDRMRDIELCEEGSDQRQPDFEKIILASVYAFTGKPEQITLVCEAHVLDDLIEKFGNDIRVRKEDEEHIRATVTASMGGMKYWALQYLSCVEVLAPEQLRAEIIEILRSSPYLEGKL